MKNKLIETTTTFFTSDFSFSNSTSAPLSPEEQRQKDEKWDAEWKDHLKYEKCYWEAYRIANELHAKRAKKAKTEAMDGGAAILFGGILATTLLGLPAILSMAGGAASWFAAEDFYHKHKFNANSTEENNQWQADFDREYARLKKEQDKEIS